MLAPDATSLRVRWAVLSASSSRAFSEASCARSTLASSSISTCPARTFAPDSKRMERTTPGLSLLMVTPRAAATLPTVSNTESQVPCVATSVPTASGGGPAASAAFPASMRLEICANLVASENTHDEQADASRDQEPLAVRKASGLGFRGVNLR